MICARPDQVKELDKYCENMLLIPCRELMARAGKGLAEAVISALKDPKRKSAVIMCGAGNNGGDGFACAKILADGGVDVALCVLSDTSKTAEAQHFRELCHDIRRVDALDDFIGFDVIVDALLGTGVKGELPSEMCELIEAANRADAYRIACDVPTGVDALLGEVGEVCFKADETVTMMLPKAGLYSLPASQMCGKLTVCDLELRRGRLDGTFDCTSYITDESYARLPKRSEDSNKGSYGRLLAVCGSDNMPGAASLVCSAALRTGVGLVRLAAPRSVISSVSAQNCEPIYLELPSIDTFSTDSCEDIIEQAEKSSALLIGCGLGASEELALFVRTLIYALDIPMILDADALNSFGEAFPRVSESKNVIITPHPLEFSRLTGLSVEEIRSSRISCALEFAKDKNVTVVLKGARTVIARPDGSFTVNTSGTPALAKGGSGDVLAGMIASFAAQGIDKCAERAAYIHGKAAEMLAKNDSEYGVLPSSLPTAAARIIADATNNS